MLEWPMLLSLLTLAAIGLALVFALLLLVHQLSTDLEEKGILLPMIRNRRLRVLLIGLIVAAVVAAIVLEFTGMAAVIFG